MAVAILMPSLDASKRKARLTRWLRREGDFVAAGDPVAEIATAHATMDVEAPESGVLARLLFVPGPAEIAADAPIALIEPGPARHIATEVSAAGRTERKSASPRARRVAREAGYDWSALAGSGPQGRVVETDVRGALASEAREARSMEAVAAITPSGRMAAAQWTPQIHLEADCRIDALEEFRAERNEQARAAQRTRISLLDCVVKALAGALRQNPRANIARTPRGYQPSRRIDVALALSVGEEIVAPALPDAADMALEEIAAARAAFLAGRFAPDAFAGGNSLVANLGAFGVKRFQPVVVAPWTVVLGVGAAEKRVVADEGALAIASILSVTLAIDRSAMDEAAAGALIATLKRLIEHPAGLVD